MYRTRRIVAALAALAASGVLALTTSVAALAVQVPAPGGATGAQQTAVVHGIVHGGMPGWQTALIATGAALVAAGLTLLGDRARAARQRVGVAG